MMSYLRHFNFSKTLDLNSNVNSMSSHICSQPVGLLDFGGVSMVLNLE